MSSWAQQESHGRQAVAGPRINPDLRSSRMIKMSKIFLLFIKDLNLNFRYKVSVISLHFGVEKVFCFMPSGVLNLGRLFAKTLNTFCVVNLHRHCVHGRLPYFPHRRVFVIESKR